MIGVIVREREEAKPSTETQKVAMIPRNQVIAVIGETRGRPVDA